MHREQIPRFNCDTEYFAIALLQGGKGLSVGNKEKFENPPNTEKMTDRCDLPRGDVSFASSSVTVSGDLVGSYQEKSDSVTVVRDAISGDRLQTRCSVMDIINELPGQK